MQELRSITQKTIEMRRLENFILKRLAIHTAIGEIKLLEMAKEHQGSEDPKIIIKFNSALLTLERKGYIEIVDDKLNTMNVIRMKNVYH